MTPLDASSREINQESRQQLLKRYERKKGKIYKKDGENALPGALTTKKRGMGMG